MLNQLLFGVIVLLVTGLVQVVEPLRGVGFTFYLGVVLAFLVSGCAIVVPWHRIRRGWILALPVLDIIAVGLLRDGQPSLGAGLLWVFPVIWLSSYFGITGAATALLLVCAIIPLNILHAADPIAALSVPSLVLLPLTLAFIALSSAIASRRSQARRRLLSRQAHTLEAALARARRQEDLVAQVLDSVDFGVIRLEQGGRVSVMNEAHARLQRAIGFEGDAPLYAADGQAQLAEEEAPFSRALSGEEFTGQTIWVGEPGASRTALSVTARRMRGEGEGSVLVSRDVTAELMAVRARDDLVASVSHELRTPLTSIIGYIELASDEQMTDDARRHLEVAERNAARLLDLVSDILAASTRGGTGELSIEPERTDLAGLARASVEALAPRAAERRITIDTHGIEPTFALVDPFRMRQVIDNLISNAIKYNVDGGAISIGTATDGQHAWIIVRDTGIGIPSAEQPRLFERFFRSETVRGSSVHGSGLGLGISRDIVRRHGGELTLQSVVNEGTTAVVQLPEGHSSA
ncbi:HAMP domain-containing sensor histidine kinase [Rathayibacter sp. YIM 133350]|uniref:sensor histidine kinase n=1 Tax=Rathayibacter sp. YIM 133350 TaxID=3131992 RepID=UPI00307DDB79